MIRFWGGQKLVEIFEAVAKNWSKKYGGQKLVESHGLTQNLSVYVDMGLSSGAGRCSLPEGWGPRILLDDS